MKAFFALSKAAAITALLSAGILGAQAADIPLSGTLVADEIETSVVSVDAPNHVVVLKGPEGKDVTIQLSDDAKALANLKAGDKVKAVVTRSVVAVLDTHVDKAPAKAAEQAGIERATKDNPHPGGAAYRQVQVQLKIKHIDVKNNQVTFEGPAGKRKVVDVIDPKNQAHLKDLKVDQSVWVTYTDTLEVTTQH